MQWYFIEGGNQQGPVDEAALRQLFGSGRLSRDSYVWREGMADWLSVAEVPELSGSIVATAAPAPSPTHPGPIVQPQIPARYAGFWWRFLAHIIDGIILNIVSQPIVMIFNFNAKTATLEQALASLGSVMAVSFIISWLYYGIMESSSWQGTLGKKMCGLAVTDEAGQRISFGRASGRYFTSILSGLLLGIGYLMVAFTERKQGLHDIIAGTLVWKK